MSEHASVVRAPAVVETAQQHRSAAIGGDGKRWPLAAVFFTAVAGLYAAVAGAIYLLVTSVSWELLAAGGLLVLIFNLVLLFVLLLRDFDSHRAERRSDDLAARHD
jgi:hypothetical protein